MPKEVISSSSAPAALGPYSHGTRAGGLLFTSGQLGLDPATGKLVDGGAVAEAEQALANLMAVLEAGGAGARDVLKVTVFVSDMADYAAVNEVYSQFFTADYPARTFVQVAALPAGAAVEMEAVAVARGVFRGIGGA